MSHKWAADARCTGKNCLRVSRLERLHGVSTIGQMGMARVSITGLDNDHQNGGYSFLSSYVAWLTTSKPTHSTSGFVWNMGPANCHHCSYKQRHCNGYPLDSNLSVDGNFTCLWNIARAKAVPSIPLLRGKIRCNQWILFFSFFFSKMEDCPFCSNLNGLNGECEA